MPPTRGRCILWKHFTKKSKTESICNVCKTVVKTTGNTSNLKQHISRYHKSLLNDENSQPQPEILSEPRGGLLEVGKNLENRNGVSSVPSTSSMGVTDDSSQPSTAGTSKSSSSSTSTMSISSIFARQNSYKDGGFNNALITNLILRMTVKDGLPFRFIESTHFQELMHLCCPLFKFPSRKKVMVLLKNKYQELNVKMMSKIEAANWICLTTDIWTDTFNTMSYLGVTAHFFNNLEHESSVLDVVLLTQSHTADYIKEQLTNVLTKWNISTEKVVAVVTDNGNNIKIATSNLFGSNKHLPCFAHTLNLVAQNAISKVQGLQDLLQKVKGIVTYFKQSVKAADELRRVQEVETEDSANILKLKQDVCTRWNSTFLMLERFLQLKEQVAIVLFKLKGPQMLTGAELDILAEIQESLRPLYRVTLELSSEQTTTVSKILSLIFCLRKNLDGTQTTTKIAEALNTSILDEIHKRFGNTEKQHIIAIATLLDPRFKKLPFSGPANCSRALTYLDSELKSLDTSQQIQESPKESDDFWSVFDNQYTATEAEIVGGMKLSLRQYLNMNPIRDRTIEPMKVWGGWKTVFPDLFQLAEKYLCVVATSVPCERLFSKTGQIISAKRNRIKPQNMRMCVFLSGIPDNMW